MSLRRVSIVLLAAALTAAAASAPVGTRRCSAKRPVRRQALAARSGHRRNVLLRDGRQVRVVAYDRLQVTCVPSGIELTFPTRGRWAASAGCGPHEWRAQAVLVSTSGDAAGRGHPDVCPQRQLGMSSTVLAVRLAAPTFRLTSQRAPPGSRSSGIRFAHRDPHLNN